MQYRCFMFTMGFVAPLRLPDKHPSELYIAGSYSRINSRYPLLERASERESVRARERERITRVDRSGGERRANYRAAKTREKKKGGGSSVAFLRRIPLPILFLHAWALIGPTRNATACPRSDDDTACHSKTNYRCRGWRRTCRHA